MEEKIDKPAYFAVLPANVRYDKELKLLSRLLFAEITSLCNKEGYCWATNKYFADLYQVSIQTISSCINQLKEKNYIQIEMIYKEGTKEILYRYIKIFEYPIKKNLNTPIKEIFKDNNTSINNKINNIKEKIKINLGEFQNVKLTEEEILKLKEIYSNKFDEAIEVLSSYLASKGDKYKNHYAVLGKHNWVYKKVIGINSSLDFKWSV